jgi:hypothetical protein
MVWLAASLSHSLRKPGPPIEVNESNTNDIPTIIAEIDSSGNSALLNRSFARNPLPRLNTDVAEHSDEIRHLSSAILHNQLNYYAHLSDHLV